MIKLKEKNVNLLNMKTIISIVLGLFLCQYSFTQILPAEEHVFYVTQGNGLPDEIIYIKDVNNRLDDYVGDWVTSYGNMNYSFKIEKHTQSSEVSRDLLLLRYQIESNGSILQTTIDLSNNHPLTVTGEYLMEGANSYKMRYFGVDYKCGQEGEIVLFITNNPNQLRFYFLQVHDTVDPDDCIDDVTYPFPIETELILNRQ